MANPLRCFRCRLIDLEPDPRGGELGIFSRCPACGASYTWEDDRAIAGLAIGLAQRQAERHVEAVGRVMDKRLEPVIRPACGPLTMVGWGTNRRPGRLPPLLRDATGSGWAIA